MVRIEGISKREAGAVTRFAYWFSRRRFGKVAEPLRVTAHHPTLLRGYGAFELALDRSSLLDERLKDLAGLKAATLVGCPF
jgi:hypothetical protein